jgi:hypothetical protein
MKQTNFLIRLLAIAVLFPVVLSWQGCPAKLDACSGTNAPEISATVGYTLTYTTAGILTNVLQSDVDASWTATSPVGKYKVVVKSIAEQGAPELTIRDTTVSGTRLRYTAARLPNSKNTVFVTPLGLDETPCESAKAALKIESPNSGTITIDIIGKKSTAPVSACVFDVKGVVTKPFCANVNDLFNTAKNVVSPSASKIVVNIKFNAPPIAQCTTYTATSWAGVQPFFLSSDVVPILPIIKTCAGLQSGNIDFDDTPKEFTVKYPN